MGSVWGAARDSAGPVKFRIPNTHGQTGICARQSRTAARPASAKAVAKNDKATPTESRTTTAPHFAIFARATDTQP